LIGLRFAIEVETTYPREDRVFNVNGSGGGGGGYDDNVEDSCKSELHLISTSEHFFFIMESSSLFLL